MPGRLVIVGHCTVDDIHHADGKLDVGTFGGAAAYASLGASIAGASVKLVSVVGDDYPVDRLEAALGARSEIDVTGIRALPGRSIHNDAWYGLDGSRRFDVESWERLELLMPEPRDLENEDLTDAIVHLAPAPVEQQESFVAALAPRAAAISLDTELHYLAQPEQQQALLRLVARVDYFLPSIEHLQLLFGSTSREPTDYLDALTELSCATIALKRGADGCSILDVASRTHWRVPALDGLELRDTTGAGDGFGGGYLGARTRGADHGAAAIEGTVSASFVVESTGAALPAHFTEARADDRRRRLTAVSSPLPATTPRQQGVAAE